MNRIILLLLLLPISIFSQELMPTNATGQVVYFNTVNVDWAKRATLYKQCLIWCNEDILAPGDSIEIADSISGKLKGKGRSTLTLKMSNGNSENGIIKYDFSIKASDSKYQYSFSNITWTHGTNIEEVESFNEGNEPYLIENRKTINHFFKMQAKDPIPPVSPPKIVLQTLPEVIVKPLSKNDNFEMNGNYLQKSGTNILIGGLCYLTGMALSIGSQLAYNQSDKATEDAGTKALNTYKTTQYVCLGLLVAGSIEIIVGGSQLFKSGQFMKDASKNNLSLQLHTNRVSLCYSL